MSPSDTHIENRTYDEIRVGDTATLERRLTMDDIKLFAVMSGDVNPAHVDEDYAKSSRFHEIIAHGMWGGALISTCSAPVPRAPARSIWTRPCISRAR
jgi:phosphate acetyltransferase